VLQVGEPDASRLKVGNLRTALAPQRTGSFSRLKSFSITALGLLDSVCFCEPALQEGFQRGYAPLGEPVRWRGSPA
jgi:hypothetical protein